MNHGFMGPGPFCSECGINRLSHAPPAIPLPAVTPSVTITVPGSYQCSMCGGWFTSAHMCVGRRSETAPAPYVWPDTRTFSITVRDTGYISAETS